MNSISVTSFSVFSIKILQKKKKSRAVLSKTVRDGINTVVPRYHPHSASAFGVRLSSPLTRERRAALPASEALERQAPECCAFPFRAGGAFSRWPIASLLRRPGAVSFNAFDCSDYKTKYAHLSRIFFILLQEIFYSPAKHRLQAGQRLQRHGGDLVGGAVQNLIFQGLV